MLTFHWSFKIVAENSFFFFFFFEKIRLDISCELSAMPADNSHEISIFSWESILFRM